MNSTVSKQIWRSVRRIALMVMTFYMLTASIAFAYTPSEDQDLYHRTQQEAKERQQHWQEKDVFLQPKVSQNNDFTLPEEKISFLIHSIQLEGEQVERFSWAKEMLNRYIGQKVGKEGINLIVKRLTNELINKGYITTRISIPEQDLSTGVLRLTIIPGVIGQIRFTDENSYENWHTAFPCRGGDILNIRDLEQGLEQMKRLSSEDVSFKIAPGTKVGESNILITLNRTKPWRLTVSLDDSGSKSTGKLQSAVTYSQDNLFGLNDLFYISANSDAERNNDLLGTKGNNFYYSVPYGYWTFTFDGSCYDYHQTIPGRNESFIYSGQSEERRLSIERMIHRDQTSKTGLSFSVIKKKSRNFVNDTEIKAQRKNVTADELAISQRQYYGKTVFDFKLAHRWGVPWFHAQEDERDEDIATTRYRLWLFNGSINTPFAIGNVSGQYTCEIQAQYTQDKLTVGDCFSIGNRYTVRGFDGEQTLAAENGWFIRNEFSVPINAKQNAYLGLDYGQVSGPSAVWLFGRRLAGMALGVRGEFSGLHYDVFTSWPLYKPKGFQSKNPVVGFQIAFQC